MIAKSIDCTSTATSTLDYLHHDKGGAITAERVAWADNVNCIQASAEETERMWAQLVDDAPEIKRQAGGSTRGRLLENPYAHYVLSWAPDENPSREEMMTATGDAMDRLGYKGCQRRVVAHSDTDHKHAHVIVCRVHPETGRAMGRKNDGDRLREWSLEYEKAQGQIRVPGRLDDLTNRARYMRQKREQPNKKPPRATDAEKKRRRERRHRRARTRDAIGRPINHTESERQEWAALLQSQPTRSEKAALKKAQTERQIKAERSERAVAATPPLMELRPAPMQPPELPRVGLDVHPAPPLMELRPAPTLHREDARVGLDVRPAPPLMELRPAPTLHREDARVGLDVRPAPPMMEIPTRPPAAARVPTPATVQVPTPAAARVPAARVPTPATVQVPTPAAARVPAARVPTPATVQVPTPAAARVPAARVPTPATVRVPTPAAAPAEERPAVAQVPRPDQAQDTARKRKRQPSSPPPAASPAPVDLAPRPDPREEKRQHLDEVLIAAAEAAPREEELMHLEQRVMYRAEREGLELAKRHPAAGALLWAAARTELEAHPTTLEISGAPRAVRELPHDLGIEIVAVAEHQSPRSSRRPPPRPAVIAETVEDVRNRVKCIIRDTAAEQGLELPAPDRTQAEPATPAAARVPTPATVRVPTPATVRVPTPAAAPAEERPAVAQVPRPDQAQDTARKRKRQPSSPPPAASPAPVDLAPRPDPREEKRQHLDEVLIAAAEAAPREEELMHLEQRVMYRAEREGLELAKRHPAAGALLWAAARTELEAHPTTLEISGAPRAVRELPHDLGIEIVAVAEHQSPRSSRRPPPRPAVIAETVEDVRNRVKCIIRDTAAEQGLELPAPDRTQAEPATTAAPADEQPAPPASEAPQHDQPAAAAPEIFRERGGDASKPPALEATLERWPTPPLYTRREIEAAHVIPHDPLADLAAIENPAPAAAPAPVELAPRPDEAVRREAERQRLDEEMQLAHVQDYAMDGTEREGADLAKRQPAPAGALWAAVRTQLEDQYAATPDVRAGARPVQTARRDLALEILAVAEHASKASSGRHAPPPRPEAVAEMAGDVQDRADRLIRHAAGELGLDISLAPDRTQAEPAPAAAPADEQPAPPPASEAPQHDQPAAAAPEIFRERGGDASKPGGAEGADLVHEDLEDPNRAGPRTGRGGR